VDGMSSKMHFSTEQEFFNQEFRAEKTFVTDAKGNIAGFKRKVGDKEYPLAVKVTNADTLNAPVYQINALAWYLLENKQFDQAINYLKRGTVLDPNDLSVSINLAHAYLFNNAQDKALQLYTTLLNKDIAPGVSFKDMIHQDFGFFKKNGFDPSLMEHILTELKLNE
jgi:tetratricopeptide (TPR) repeat protein